MSIVIVEPSNLGRRILRGYLEERQCHVVAFANAEEAFRYIQNNKDVDILLTSFETEGMHGMELVWETRMLEADDRPLYIIAMSSDQEITKAVEALDCGADDFIRKPPVAEELKARVRSAQRLLSHRRELTVLASHDTLTSLLNRKAFTRKAEAKINATLRPAPSCFAMIDIDHFKQVNDMYGHSAGDLVIQSVARIIESKGHLAGRFGGDEFLLLASGLDQASAAQLAEAICRDVEATPFIYEGSRIKVTVSIGVTELAEGEEATLEAVLKRADDALFQAKRNGRNQVHLTAPATRFLAFGS